MNARMTNTEIEALKLERDALKIENALLRETYKNDGTQWDALVAQMQKARMACGIFVSDTWSNMHEKVKRQRQELRRLNRIFLNAATLQRAKELRKAEKEAAA